MCVYVHARAHTRGLREPTDPRLQQEKDHILTHQELFFLVTLKVSLLGGVGAQLLELGEHQSRDLGCQMLRQGPH